MRGFQFLAQPWWGNFLLVVPFAVFWGLRRSSLHLRRTQLLAATVFAIAFGYAETAVVVYLRAATGLLPGYLGTLAQVRGALVDYDQSQSITRFPQSLLMIEVWRETATLFMLASVGVLGAKRLGERGALFLWTFAIWDLAYYAGLWATIRWPASFRNFDVCSSFLCPGYLRFGSHARKQFYYSGDHAPQPSLGS
jgi:hypothetical protein